MKGILSPRVRLEDRSKAIYCLSPFGLLEQKITDRLLDKQQRNLFRTVLEAGQPAVRALADVKTQQDSSF